MCLQKNIALSKKLSTKNHSALLVKSNPVRAKKPSVNSESGTLCVSICMFQKYIIVS